eukprot:866021-Amphidinium_carterae.2
MRGRSSSAAGADGFEGKTCETALASHREGSREDSCEIVASGSEPNRAQRKEGASAAVHGSSQGSTCEEASEAEGEEARYWREETMAKTVNWIRTMLRDLEPAWLRHHTASRDLLPLPVCACNEGRVVEGCLETWRGSREAWDEQTVRAADCWLEVIVMVLNMQVKATSVWWTPKQTQRVALRRLWDQCVDFVMLDVSETPWQELEPYLKACKIDYNGEIAVMAEELSWTRVQAALPPASICAVLHVEDI